MRADAPLLLLAIAAAGCGAQTRVRSAPRRAPSAQTFYVSRQLTLPAAHAFGEPGFHQVLTASARLPGRLVVASAWHVVLALRDAGRPGQRCAIDHPLSGCATVDWSDDPSRPNVPPDGVFRNALTVRVAGGTRTLFLRQSGALAATPDPYQPG